MSISLGPWPISAHSGAACTASCTCTHGEWKTVAKGNTLVYLAHGRLSVVVSSFAAGWAPLLLLLLEQPALVNHRLAVWDY